MSEQDYIPGTSVIRNLIRRAESSPYGSQDPRVLAEAENFCVSTRIAELRMAPITGTFTFGHMRAIHQHLFQDVYAWAGEPRNVPMTKHDTAYASPAEMPALLREQYTRLAAERRLRGINDQAEFTQKLAGFWGEINHGHAFREGNTRTQTVFFEQLAEHAGWKLDVQRLSPHHPQSLYQDFVNARFEHQRIRGTDGLSAQEAASELANVLGQLIEPDRSAAGCMRRGVPLTSPTPQVAATVARLRARSPELRAMKLDPYGLGDEHDPAPDAGSDFQR
ncbi:Fic/DOC family protein [Cryobacterium sp. 5B3]|uniref:Fic/DOC family protein n=1 Tax=Cryobacterium sp. 5B3 TaxID=3048586 RepID=UPI002AB4DC1B|nr:Fic family protein [Cryobacterium sp. 5B3]MDY7541775.1 Fic family protein [Cryobacterium sp. 5B3]MEB0275245.1 Fic family protein [Cryobacterium sp. 5B3]